MPCISWSRRARADQKHVKNIIISALRTSRRSPSAAGKNTEPRNVTTVTVCRQPEHRAAVRGHSGVPATGMSPGWV